MLVWRHPGLLFRVHSAGWKKKISFWDGKDSINPYDIFVTKKITFRNEHQKKKFDPHVSCRPGPVTANQHNFKSGLILFCHRNTYKRRIHSRKVKNVKDEPNWYLGYYHKQIGKIKNAS